MQWTFDLSQINTIAKELSTHLKHPVVCIEGPMGAGKTTFIQALSKVLGCKDIANSPTFALVNTYQTLSGANIHHFDCYRLNHIHEALDMGIEEYLDSGNKCFIEWPQLIYPLLDEYHTLTLELKNNQLRTLKLLDT
jgi:tRNA threonylcarbamoyladenosine biosynthesis protein TsaE